MLQTADLSVDPHLAERKRASSLVCSYKGANPILEGSTLMTQLPPKGSTSKNHHIVSQDFSV